MKCPACKGCLESYHSGVMCKKCLLYYERNSWWSVACDDAHAHSQKCLTEEKFPVKKEKKASKVCK